MADVPRGPLHILIVEDEALIAMELEWIVTSAAHEVVGHAMDSVEALALARERRPDLALVDIHLLDGPTGVDAARSIVSEVGAMVVFTTANRKRIPPDFASACGVVQKPYSECGVAAAINYIAGCIKDGRATGDVPPGLDISPNFRTRWGIERAGSAPS